ncbi:MAG: hypothetical protein QXM98_03895, partial [Thermoproteota archaeon]
MRKESRLQDVVFILNIALTPVLLVLIIMLSSMLEISFEKFFLLCMISFIFDYPRVLAKVFLLPIAERLRKPAVMRSGIHVSVIIPAHNEERTIAACIES